MNSDFIGKMRLVKKYKSLPNLLSAIGGKNIEEYHSQAKKKHWTTIEVKGPIDEYKNCVVCFHIRLTKDGTIEIEGSDLKVYSRGLEKN